MKLSQVKMTFELADWRAPQLAGFSNNAKRMKKITDSAGSTSQVFKSACKKLLGCASSQELVRLLKSALDIRAYTFLLGSDEDFRKNNFPNREVLTNIRGDRWPLGRLTLMNLIRVFANAGDETAASSKDLLGAFITESFTKNNKKLTGELLLMQGYAAKIFNSKGPEAVAALAISERIPLDSCLRKVGLNALKGSSFVRSCFTQYYIKSLEQLNPGANSPVLDELRKPEVNGAFLSEGKLVGHRALEILIDKTPRSGPSEAWQAVVLGIAGDPRVGRQSQRYQRWWQLLGADRVRKVTSWLSRLDLKIFLEVLEASATDSNKEDILRMFPPRKKFMEGLMSEGLVVQSRLFLSTTASHFIESNFKKDDIPEYAQIRSGYTSIIYLELSNGLHMIEGTHSFKLKIMTALPSRPPISNFAVKRFSDSDFRTEIIRRFNNELESRGKQSKYGDNYIDVVHRGPVSWQFSALSMIRGHGVTFDPSAFFIKKDYRTLKETYGLGGLL
jgi:hypothetical protein